MTSRVPSTAAAAAARIAGAVSAALGAALLLRPAAVTRLVGDSGDAPSHVVARALGGRQLLQGIALITRPQPPVVAIAAATDALHAASMLLLGWIRPGYRRPAIVSAAAAAASAGCGAMILRLRDHPMLTAGNPATTTAQRTAPPLDVGIRNVGQPWAHCRFAHAPAEKKPAPDTALGASSVVRARSNTGSARSRTERHPELERGA